MKRFTAAILTILLCLSFEAQTASALTSADSTEVNILAADGCLTVSVDVNGTTEAMDTGVTGPCTAVAGVYDGSGKLLGIGTSDVVQGQTTADIAISAASLPDDAVLRLFLLDSGDKPLREAISMAVSDMDTEAIRVVVDGKVGTYNARLSGGEWYLKPADIEEALGVDAEATLNGYASLRAAAEAADVSYEHDGVLDAAYIWTEETYEADPDTDFNRAVSLGFVPDGLETDTDRQITSTEFRSLLSAMIGALVPDEVSEFEANVTTYEKPLLRGEGFVMAYFAAVCVGADTKNNDFDNTKANQDGNFWDITGYELGNLFPNVWVGPVYFSNMTQPWNDYFTAAFLWSFWHSSPYSDIQVFEYDETAGSMRQKEALTVKEAVGAAVRIYDSYSGAQYVSLSDTKAVSVDSAIITDKLLSKAAALPALTLENMPVWKGFVLSQGGDYEKTDITESDEDLRTIANWGFNSVRLMLAYRTLFDEDVDTVNVTNLKKLDALIAAAIKYNLHIDVLTFTLPGRWTWTDYDTYKTTGSFDLFTNEEEQAQANRVWALLAERYKDIPSATLSFCPIWEAQNYNLSSGQNYEPYTPADVAEVYGQLVSTIKAHDPDRFVIYEPTSSNTASQIIEESNAIKETVEGIDPEALMMSNFCEMPFVYADMTASDGVNIDHVVNSAFKTEYPTTIYAAQYHIDNGSTLDMNGELVAGTVIDIYLSGVDGEGEFKITADGETLYGENLETRTYEKDSPHSRYFPYAKSDKCITVTLPSDVGSLQIGYDGNWFEWSEVDVTLPEAYAVERWWVMSDYDAAMSGVEKEDPVLKETSTVTLSPNSYNSGRTITINPDVTYTSSGIFAQSNRQTIEAWAQTMSAYSPDLIVRFECAAFSSAVHDSAMAYYNDLLSVLDEYGISWFSNDYWSMKNADYFYAGAEPVAYEDYTLDVDMLKLLQSYQ